MRKTRKQIIKNYTVEATKSSVGARRKDDVRFPRCREGRMLIVVASTKETLITLGVDAKAVDVNVNGYVLTRKNGKKTYLLRISER